jgi:GTP-binding protein
VRDKKSVCLLRELVRDGEAFIVARGGKGGLGNSWRKQATDGEAGQERELLLDLRLIADVGLLGFPNAGKSTFITAVSNARPKIAAYPFTTKFPTLGRVQAAGKDFVIADIPGLIAGSAQGRGLGDRFLRHIERTRLILHIIDMAGSEGRDPLQDYRIINQELKAYSRQLLKKPQFIAANKMDLETAEANLLRFKRNIAKKIYPISALKKDGLEVLLEAIAAKL